MRHPRVFEPPAGLHEGRILLLPGRAVLASCLAASVALAQPDGDADAYLEPLKPIPGPVDVNAEKAALGRALFHDARLSRDDTVSCASCHDLSSGGDDGRRYPIGIEGRIGTVNTPTVYNAALNFKQSWDGRADTLEQQVDDPVQSPQVMGSLWPDVVAKLHEDSEYPQRFEALYPDGITRNSIRNAIAEFIRSLTTPDSRFDRWLKGDVSALDRVEKRGYDLFKRYGCISCHQGANVGGNMFQVFGVRNEYFKKRGTITKADLGRFNVTGHPDDRHVFKVPSLRMAAHTAPYLHDGSAATLRDAVEAMFEVPTGVATPPDGDMEAIVAFIETLAGESKELSPMRFGALILGIVVSVVLLAAAGGMYMMAGNQSGQHYRDLHRSRPADPAALLELEHRESRGCKARTRSPTSTRWRPSSPRWPVSRRALPTPPGASPTSPTASPTTSRST